MILRRLALRDFRRFAAYETAFASGLNVVLGDNEAGKSTLREAITAALFYDPKTSNKVVQGLRRWGAAEQFCVELEYEADGEVFLLTKDFQKKTARLENRTSGVVLTDARAIDRHVGAVLGLASKALFDSTVRVSQRDITNLQNPGAIADSLQQVMTGGEDDARASDVLKKLDEALKALKSAGRANPGPLYALPGEITTKERTLGNKRADLERAANDARELFEKQGELEMAESDLQKKQAILEDVAERLKLESERTDAETSERDLADRLDAIGRLQRQVAAGEEKREQYDLVLSLSEARVGEFSILEQQASAHMGNVPSPASLTKTGPRVPVLVLGAVVGLVGVIGGLNQPPLFALFVAGAGIIAWELLKARVAEGESARAATALYAQRQREDAKRASSRLQALLAEVGCQSTEGLHDKRRRGLDLQDGLSRQRGQLEGLLAGETGEEIEAKRRKASDSARWLRDQLAATRLQLAKMDQPAYLRLEAEVKALQ
ncbi:MAG: AAA family ATPase, partial [Chloroflexota bacterium]